MRANFPKKSALCGWSRAEGRFCSVPAADADQETGLVRVASAGFDPVGRSAEGAAIFHANIGREFTADLVAEAQARLQVGQARSEIAFGNVLRREGGREPGLEDQPLRQPQVVFGFGACGQVARIAEIGGLVDLEPIRRTAWARPSGSKS